MRIEEFSFEVRPLSELPPDDVTQWLADLSGDDAVWVDSGDGQPERAGAVMGNHIILWQDEPITYEYMRDAVSMYEYHERKVLAEEAFGDFVFEYDWDYEDMISPLLRFVQDKQLTEDFRKYLADEEGLTTSWDRRKSIGDDNREHIVPTTKSIAEELLAAIRSAAKAVLGNIHNPGSLGSLLEQFRDTLADAQRQGVPVSDIVNTMKELRQSDSGRRNRRDA